MPRHPLAVAVAAAIVLGLGTAGCGGSSGGNHASTSALQACRHRWHDVAGTVVGLDQDTDPSGLASRWTSVIATIDYYEHTTTAQGCEANIASQVKAIDALRAFVDRVRRYDMAYQAAQVRASADLYAHDPLPTPARSATGKLVPPPTKEAVAAATATLDGEAGTANTDLQPGWEQLASVELTDEKAVASALQDLDFLAQDSTAWRHCEQALQVITAAIRAQEGDGAASERVGGTPSATPSAG